ncbi:hypothetical protein Tsubulata_037737 [Turnera subulata]|uniref:Dof zinc finger protein n=1 Tax=Turnera subulata TaxID=218843 RepID=A0A9Q0GGW7_9ROSI|nr:hypothetical protein Tsubulata_037737 [Turnera subulata]
MQDPATAFQPMKPQFPEQEQLKCPRCDSSNTKFCYYNNYNLSQPRHFCKNCRRYWTKGGALRNIPVGGGTRKGTKRNSSSSANNPKRANPDPPPPDSTRPVSRRATDSPASSSSTPPAQAASSGHLGSGQDGTRMYGLEGDPDRKVLDMSGSFSSLLASSGQFGSIFEGLGPNGSGLKMVQMGGFGEDLNSDLNVGPGQEPGLDLGGSGDDHNNNGDGSAGGGEGYLQSGDWGNSNGWPDLAIYTPGSSFQ